MVYVVFLTVLTRLVFHHFMPGNYMFFCFHFNINIVLISSKFVCESNCPFRRPLLTFHLANQLASFKLANEKAAQSSSATKADMCSGHKLISLGLKKQGWCYYWRHSGQDNYIHRKKITIDSCVVQISHCAHRSLVTTVLNCIYLRAFYHQNIVKRKDRIFIAEVWYKQIYFSYTILIL